MKNMIKYFAVLVACIAFPAMAGWNPKTISIKASIASSTEESTANLFAPLGETIEFELEMQDVASGDFDKYEVTVRKNPNLSDDYPKYFYDRWTEAGSPDSSTTTWNTSEQQNTNDGQTLALPAAGVYTATADMLEHITGIRWSDGNYIAPTCEVTLWEVRIDSIDTQFAPTVESLDVHCTIYPPGIPPLNIPNYARIEVFKKGDSQSYIHYEFKLIPWEEQSFLFNWDGKHKSGGDMGSYAHPKDSEFRVEITASESIYFERGSTDSAITKVEIESIALTPSGNENVVKPGPAYTSKDKDIEALVKVKKKDGSGVVTELPFTINWSFEDPDDTATSTGIDSNGSSGDDNAPIANGGRKGTTLEMWKAISGFTATPNKNTATSETKTSGDDKGKTKLQFTSSVIGGDNYILVAQIKDTAGTVLKEKKTGTWSVRKTATFPNVYNMNGGVDAGTIMAKTNIDPAFSGDGYTDYDLGNVTNLPVGNKSPEYIVPLLAPIASETPTGQEVTDYLGMDAAKSMLARTAITAKAQAWYTRNNNNRGPALNAYITLIGASGRCIIGGRRQASKLDGDNSTGGTNYYPTGITISVYGGGNVDPDGDWYQPQGTTLGTVVFIWQNSGNAARQQIVGRHEAGHASDHEPFGVSSEHATSGLMTPTGSTNTFSDDSILRLRGWKR